MDEHFLAVANAMGAEWGDWDFYLGILDRAPFLLRQTASEPPGCYFKFRKKGRLGRPGRVVPRPAQPARPGPPGTPPAAWQDRLPEAYAKAEVSCEVDDEYVFLWISKPHLLPPEDIATLARECVLEHASVLPDQDRLCLTCGSTGEADLFHSEASVTTICPRCLDQKLETHTAVVEKLNRPTKKRSVLFPLALIGGSIAWAVLWNIYENIIQELKAMQLTIPSGIVVLLAVALGFCVGRPIGMILRRPETMKRLQAVALAILAALTIVVIGELLFGVVLVYAITGSMDVDLVSRATLLFTSGSNPSYARAKFLFACALAVAVYEASKPTTKSLRL